MVFNNFFSECQTNASAVKGLFVVKALEDGEYFISELLFKADAVVFENYFNV